jgi:hypothetical protein
VSTVATHRVASCSDAYSRHRLTKQQVLVCEGAPAAVDVDLDRLAGRCFAKSVEQPGIQPRDARVAVVEHGDAVRALAVRDSHGLLVAARKFGGRRRRPLAASSKGSIMG